jgi:hypothetical protein
VAADEDPAKPRDRNIGHGRSRLVGCVALKRQRAATWVAAREAFIARVRRRDSGISDTV